MTLVKDQFGLRGQRMAPVSNTSRPVIVQLIYEIHQAKAQVPLPTVVDERVWRYTSLDLCVHSGRLN